MALFASILDFTEFFINNLSSAINASRKSCCIAVIRIMKMKKRRIKIENIIQVCEQLRHEGASDLESANRV